MRSWRCSSRSMLLVQPLHAADNTGMLGALSTILVFHYHPKSQQLVLLQLFSRLRSYIVARTWMLQYSMTLEILEMLQPFHAPGKATTLATPRSRRHPEALAVAAQRHGSGSTSRSSGGRRQQLQWATPSPQHHQNTTEGHHHRNSTMEQQHDHGIRVSSTWAYRRRGDPPSPAPSSAFAATDARAPSHRRHGRHALRPAKQSPPAAAAAWQGELENPIRWGFGPPQQPPTFPCHVLLGGRSPEAPAVAARRHGSGSTRRSSSGRRQQLQWPTPQQHRRAPPPPQHHGTAT